MDEGGQALLLSTVSLWRRVTYQALCTSERETPLLITVDEKPDSPVPSSVSMRSDDSKGLIMDVKDPETSIQQEQTIPPFLSTTTNNELSAVFEELEHKVVTFMKHELMRLKKLLSHDYPESPCDDEEDEEDQRDARDGALKIAVHILRNMSQEILAQQLDKYGMFPRCQQELKYRLTKRLQSVSESIPMKGKPTFLETELYMSGGGSLEVNAEHEVRQIEIASKRNVTKEDTAIKCTDIFKPLPGQDKPIRTVLSKGVAGIGKTVSVQKFILDWAEGKANQNINLVFPLPFRELNLMKDKHFTLMDLIHHFFSETKDFAFSKPARYSIAFIFDGLDESRLPLDFQHRECIYSVTESASVDVLLTNLIQGNLLPSALIWITSRPAAANQIPPECVDRVTEVGGFNDPQKEEYIRKKITEEELASRIITHLKSSRSLYIMCHIPVFCWMVTTVLECIMAEAESGEIPKSLTQMYTHFLIIQTKHRSQKYGTPDVEALWNLRFILSLGKLAFQQLEKGNLIFYEEDLRECDIGVIEAFVFSGVCTQIFREEAGLYQGKVFSFVHLSVQEFLAALYVFLHFSMREGDISDQHQTSQLYSLFSANRLNDLHHIAVDLALNNENGHLDLFLRFLLGLSLESNQKLLQGLLPQIRSSSLNTEDTVKYIYEKIRETTNPERCINLFHCLNEMNDHSLVEEVQGYLRKGNKARGNPSLSQLSALVFVLLMSDQELEELKLLDYGLHAGSDEGLLRMLPVVKASRKVQMSWCDLTEKSCAALASTLSSNSSSLRQLDLSVNNLGDSGVELLSAGLEHPNCRLEKLELWRCDLTVKSCAALSSALRSNSSSLIHLNLNYNNVGDSGVELLSTGLEHPNCRLETLKLWSCKLTDVSCAALSSTLSSNSSSLRQLQLSENNLGDSGVQLLSTGLEHPNCRLETLELWDCKLTGKSCASLSSALRSNSSSLRQLDISYNNMRDSGVELLSAGLEYPNSKLVTLELKGCDLTEKSCAALSSALRSNSSSLRQLDLSGNNLGDSGVKLLSTGLEHPNCRLEILKLRGCNFTGKSCTDLSSALDSNPSSLRHLDLSNNNLGDSGVELLSAGLEHPNCRLEKLELRKCNLTVRSCSSLASALRSNPSSQRELDLRNNTLQQSGVELLSALQRDPTYKLTELMY
ncbi:NACHT, LRR and PYD domains-containing protein 12-like isoform X2 [Alosa sapidissima]|uniref:NACHT, LRR and PYD domains-containing protein 12-like isoform X2 n=1 Tax=Alosa sapidissima TaxID=34773 RepID=UPI001C0A2859|nr:NACHT, LRR and PYD domains-containing protein 12-like isoform X2 [Alosa sapidissima]XP_041948519.1 NACHT, LRR and PYD domains-containing protein 12-like isoform X2 [Alosa sapidissima]